MINTDHISIILYNICKYKVLKEIEIVYFINDLVKRECNTINIV